MPRASWASWGSLRGVHAGAVKAWAAPALTRRGLGRRAAPPPQPPPGAPRRPGPHLLRITSATSPHPLQTEKDWSPLNIQTFFVFIFFQGRSNIFQMRQNRDGSEASSAVPASRPRRSFWPWLARPSPCLGISRAALFLLWVARSLRLLSTGVSFPPPLPVCIPLCLPDSVSLAFPSASSVCLSVCKSLVPSKLSDPPSQHRAEGPQGRRRSPSSPPAAFPPRRPRQVSPPAPPARTWSPRPAPPPLLPATRVKAGAGVLNGVSRAPSSGPCAP